MKITIFLSMIALMTFSSCGKNDPPPAAAPRSTVEIQTISPDGCLNLPAYFQSIEAMSSTIPVLEVSTDFDLSSKKTIRPKFRKVMAYTTFALGTKPLSEFSEFKNISQDSCNTVTFRSVDGNEEIYSIEESSREMLSAKHEDGRSLKYTWLSPQRMHIDVRYNAFDLPCTKGDPIIVRHARVLDWSGMNLTTIAEDSAPFAISRDYLALVAETVGRDSNSLYDTGANAEQVLLVVSRVQELASLPPRPEMLTCAENAAPPPENEGPTGPTPAPEPAPEESENPASPGDPATSPEEVF